MQGQGDPSQGVLWASPLPMSCAPCLSQGLIQEKGGGGLKLQPWREGRPYLRPA